MTFLGTLLPGVRDLRTPLAIGTLLIASTLILLHLLGQSIDPSPAYAYVERSLAIPALAIATAVVGSSAFVVGVVAAESVAFLALTAQRALVKARQEPGTHYQRLEFPAWLARFDRLAVKHPTVFGSLSPRPETNALMTDFVKAHMSKYSRTAWQWIPESILRSEIDQAVVRLSKEAPEQYQDYDRAESEEEFRLGVAVPLFLFLTLAALAIGSPFGSTVLVLVGIVSMVMLLRSAGVKRRRKEAVLYSALRFDYTRFPFLETLDRVADESWRPQSRIAEVDRPRRPMGELSPADQDVMHNGSIFNRDDVRELEWLGWFLEFLNDRDLIRAGPRDFWLQAQQSHEQVEKAVPYMRLEEGYAIYDYIVSHVAKNYHKGSYLAYQGESNSVPREQRSSAQNQTDVGSTWLSRLRRRSSRKRHGTTA